MEGTLTINVANVEKSNRPIEVSQAQLNTFTYYNESCYACPIGRLLCCLLCCLHGDPAASCADRASHQSPPASSSLNSCLWGVIQDPRGSSPAPPRLGLYPRLRCRHGEHAERPSCLLVCPPQEEDTELSQDSDRGPGAS